MPNNQLTITFTGVTVMSEVPETSETAPVEETTAPTEETTVAATE